MMVDSAYSQERMKRYFGYIRVSTTKQGEQGSSLQEQKAAIEGYASRHGLRIIEWFEEQETAAAQGRPVFGRMLKAIERHEADGVITHKIDRSARNLKDWAYIGELIDRGVEMHFAHESIDLTSRSGRLSGDILAVVAADYIRNLRDEVRKGFYGRLKQGLYPLGAPLGYLDQGGGKAKTIDPIRGPIIKQGFELYRTGLWTLETLGEELNRRGLRSRKGRRVSQTGLSIILNNTFYIGIIKISKTDQVFQGVHEPLVDVATFKAVADVLAGRTPRRGSHKRYRYQKMLKCVECKYGLTPERQKGHVYYRCHTRSCSRPCIRQSEIERQLLQIVEPVTFSDAEWKLVEKEVDRILISIPDDRPQQRKATVLQIAASEERLRRTTDAFIDNLIDQETYTNRKEQLLQEQAALRDVLAKLDQAATSPRYYATKFFELTKRLSSLAISLPDERVREILVDTTSNLSVRSKDLVIAWRQPFDKLLLEPSVLLGGPNRGQLRTFALAHDIAKIAIEMSAEHGKPPANDNNSISREQTSPSDGDARDRLHRDATEAA